MILPYVLNTFFASALIIIIIFAECLIKYSSDRILKKIFCTFLAITFLSLMSDLFYSIYKTAPVNIMIKNDFTRSIINFMPVFIALFIVIYLRKMYKEINRLIILLLFLYIISISASIIIGSVKMTWPLLAALLLYTYLFIILKENKIDSLTGLDNRYSFFEYFSRISRAKTGESWKVLMVDLNNFKMINEVYGHLEGDTTLRNVAKIIKTCIRKVDFAARYGGDEFVVVSKDITDMDILIAKIEDELGRFNENSEKPYNIEVDYGHDAFVTDGSMQVDEFLNNIHKYIHKHNEDTRRAGDLKS